MSEEFTISATETGIIRVFALDLDADAATAFATTAADDPGVIARGLGVDSIDPAYAELFPISNLTGLGLAGYLTEGLGVPEDQVAQDRARLNALEGHVLVVTSKAFAGQPVTLKPQSPLRWVGTYTEEGAPVNFAPLPDEGAKGTIAAPATKPGKSDARMSGMVATIALVAMFMLVGLMIWIAG